MRLLPFPGRPGRTAAAPGLYGDPRAGTGGDADWIAFIDADEFLVPAAGIALAAGAPRRACADPRVGAVVVNWALYGSAGRLEAEPTPVIERFDRRAEQDRLANHHFKSIVRTAAAPATGETPHAFRLLAPYRTVHADGRPVRPHPIGRPGLSAEVVWEPLRLNHYVVKSREEFLTRKLPRGRATTAWLRDPGFFAEHDRNEVGDPLDPALRAEAREEAGGLARRLGLSQRRRRPRPDRARAGGEPRGSALHQPAGVPAQQVGADHEEAERDRRARRRARRSRDRRSRRSPPAPAPPHARSGCTT